MKTCRKLLAIGLAPFLAQSANSLMGIILNVQLERFGAENALSVSGVIYRSAQIIFAVVLGIWQGAQPIIGYNYGARKRQRIYRSFRFGVLYASCFMLLGFTLFQLIPQILLGLFHPSAAMLAIGVPALRRISVH